MHKSLKNLEKLIQIYKLDPAGISDSTSTHLINGDAKLNQSEIVLYMLLNYMNNINDVDSINLDPQIFDSTVIKDFSITKKQLDLVWKKIDIKSSPSRKMGDIFWSTLPYEEFGEINILDVGCGKGNYSKKLWEWSNKRMASYMGLDIFPTSQWATNEEWGKSNNVKINFRKINIDEDSFQQIIPPNTNFFMSQSSLEHIKYDLKYFKNVKKYSDTVDFPVYQVHLLIAPASLRLFLLHGYRQYGLNSISKIVDIFQDSSIELIKLCGDECNKVHYEYITEPLYMSGVGDLRETKTEQYDADLYKAAIKDMKNPIPNPGFWALVIKTN